MKTDKTAQLGPFHTHVIGSLPRPKLVRDLLADRDRFKADEYLARMDEMVMFAIRLQERAGMDVVSDGEWRRSQYIREFLQRVGGCERARPFRHHGELKQTDVIVRRMSANEPVFSKGCPISRPEHPSFHEIRPTKPIPHCRPILACRL